MNSNQSTVLAWHRQRYRVCPRDRHSNCGPGPETQSATSRRSERSSNIPRREVNLGSVLRSFGTAATFDILVARIQTTGTRGDRLARVKAGGANVCSKLTQIKRALSGCRGPVTAAQAVSRRHGGRDHQHFAERFGAHEPNQPARTIEHADCGRALFLQELERG